MFYRAINHEKRFIAFFSPKCGCNTLKSWFWTSLDVSRGNRGRFGKHLVSKDMILDYDYRRVMFVRNPFDRLVSFYCHFIVPGNKRWQYADKGKTRSLKTKTFAEFLYILAVLQHSGKRFQHHLEDQGGGIENLRFDFSICMEYFDQDIPWVNERLGIEDYQPERLNATTYKTQWSGPCFDMTPKELSGGPLPPKEAFWGDNLRELASMIYRRDIELYERVRLERERNRG